MQSRKAISYQPWKHTSLKRLRTAWHCLEQGKMACSSYLWQEEYGFFFSFSLGCIFVVFFTYVKNTIIKIYYNSSLEVCWKNEKWARILWKDWATNHESSWKVGGNAARKVKKQRNCFVSRWKTKLQRKEERKKIIVYGMEIASIIPRNYN